MNVYYMNEIKNAGLHSDELESSSSLTYLTSDYLALRSTFFNNDYVKITGSWGLPRYIQCIVISDTNAETAAISFNNGANMIQAFGPWPLKYMHNVFYTETAWDVLNFTLELTAQNLNARIYLGALYAGIKNTMPRFGTAPEISPYLGSDAQRTRGGQVFGLDEEQLETRSVEWPFLREDGYLQIKNYMADVTTRLPHIIDLYPEGHDVVPPLYCTIDSSSTLTKRENPSGFFWTASLSWKEAK